MAINVYGSITDSSSQVKNLLDYYLNTDNSIFNDILIVRDGERSYTLYYADKLGDGQSADYIRYSSSGGTSSYAYSSGRVNSTVLSNSNGYTTVGTVLPSLHSSQYSSYRFNLISSVMIFIIALFTGFQLLRGRLGVVRRYC